MKRCSKCKQEKQGEEFCVDKRNRGGLAAECKECHKGRTSEWKKENRAAYSASRRAAYQLWKDANKDNPMSWREWSGWSHGLRITVGDYQALLDKQGGVCAICKEPEKRRDSRNNKLRMLCVDHDHETGEVRGLLCSDCNTAIGLLKDNPSTLVAAIEYLARNDVASEKNWNNV